QRRMWAYALGFTVLPHIGGFLSWFFNRKEMPVWYEKLKKPSWCPPCKILSVAWSVLYTGMGYASYLIWNDLGGYSSKIFIPLGLYGAQLALNWAWTRFFFRARNLKLALINVLCLDGLAIGTVFSWFHINKIAVLLMVPYLGWLAVATYLTTRIWKDNREEKPKKSE
ncbi:TSPO protein, partial [Cochlearius cochlearius]|nr:TSPO protein [Cochlearius cochlearius]